MQFKNLGELKEYFERVNGREYPVSQVGRFVTIFNTLTSSLVLYEQVFLPDIGASVWQVIG